MFWAKYLDSLSIQCYLSVIRDGKIQIRDGKIRIRYLGWKNPDPESGINILDPQ
jgi:hypothetical protein